MKDTETKGMKKGVIYGHFPPYCPGVAKSITNIGQHAILELMKANKDFVLEISCEMDADTIIRRLSK